MTAISERPGAIGILPIYVYLNFDAKFLKEHKYFIPHWLRAKTMVNTASLVRKIETADLKLFEGKAVDLSTLLEDLARGGRQMAFIHMMNRDHGGVRIRISWFKDGDVLPENESIWVTNVIKRFFFDTKAYKRFDASEHLPPHVNISGGNPVERTSATSVFSVQVIDDEPSLINDPS